jgi:hypothetical protein
MMMGDRSVIAQSFLGADRDAEQRIVESLWLEKLQAGFLDQLYLGIAVRHESRGISIQALDAVPDHHKARELLRKRGSGLPARPGGDRRVTQ